jgi:hypothetical protein
VNSTVIQSEEIKKTGILLKDQWINQYTKICLYQVSDKYFLIWHRQEIMIQPYKVEEITEQQAKEILS